ncbi:MAG: carbohydrate ABC transporter permease [Chloroflexi bacterium]|nr:MAG: carbohydrate ABC transporter permease [Chloroflexota bacterium]
MRKQLAPVPYPTAREPATTDHAQKRYRPKRFNLSSLGAMTFLFVFAMYFLVPYFWLVVSATKTGRDLVTTFGLWFAPHFNLFANLQLVFTIDHSIFVQWLLNTLIYAGIGSVVGTVFACMAGYAMAKYSFPGRTFVFTLVLGSSIVSPFGVYLSRIYTAASVPDELLEAARMDGAGEFRIFATIAMRLMMPAQVTILLFQFVAIWNNYFLPLVMLSNENLFPLTVGLKNWGAPILVLPGALVSTIPLLLSCIFLQRYWRSGLGAGSVKG